MTSQMNGSPNPAQPQVTVHPQPTPIQVICQVAHTPDGSPMCVVQLMTVTGMTVAMWNPAEAEMVGQQIVDMARSASARLHLPGPGRMPPPSGHHLG